MKTIKNSITVICTLIILLLTTHSGYAQHTNGLTKKEKTFLIEATDARMMDWHEAKEASGRSSSPSIIKYAEMMMKDQKGLLEEITTLAKSKNITLPDTLSDKKANGLKDLKEEEAEDFDEAFIKMMIIDHKRDVKEFEKAGEFEDLEIRAFANKNLNLIKSHLRKAQQLKKSL